MRKTLNKLLLGILSMVVAFAVVGCGDTGREDVGAGEQDVSASEQAQALHEKEISDAKKAYASLSLVNNYCNEMSSAIHTAWHFAIYDAEDEQNYMVKYVASDEWKSYIATSFLLRTSGMNDVVMIERSFENILGECSGVVWAGLLKSNSYSVGVANEYNKLSGALTAAKEGLEKAKGIIEKLSEDNKQSTRKDDLVDLYSTLTSYYNIIENPTGSYVSYGASISSYKTDISTLISKMEIYLA